MECNSNIHHGQDYSSEIKETHFMTDLTSTVEQESRALELSVSQVVYRLLHFLECRLIRV
jgi:hypothetical protein